MTARATAWLASPQGRAALAGDVDPEPAQQLATVARLRAAGLPPQHAAAVVECAQARHRARGRLDTDGWLLTREGTEQATAHLARSNVPTAAVACADALSLRLPRRSAVFADPSRRVGGRRVPRPSRWSPPLAQLLALQVADVGVKVAPGLDLELVPPSTSWRSSLPTARSSRPPCTAAGCALPGSAARRRCFGGPARTTFADRAPADRRRPRPRSGGWADSSTSRTRP